MNVCIFKAYQRCRDRGTVDEDKSIDVLVFNAVARTQPLHTSMNLQDWLELSSSVIYECVHMLGELSVDFTLLGFMVVHNNLVVRPIA